jgi:hypothetical protein
MLSFSLWHKRLGHINIRRMHDMEVLNFVSKSAIVMVDKNRICMLNGDNHKTFLLKLMEL